MFIHEWQIMNIFTMCNDDIDSMIEHLRHLLSLGDKVFLEQAFHPHEKDRESLPKRAYSGATSLLHLFPISIGN